MRTRAAVLCGMMNKEITPRKRRRSRYRYVDVPDLTRGNSTAPTIDRRMHSQDQSDNDNQRAPNGNQNTLGRSISSDPQSESVALYASQSAYGAQPRSPNPFQNHEMEPGGQNVYAEDNVLGLIDEPNFLEDQENDRADLAAVSLSRRCSSIGDWKVVWGLLATNGTNKLTKPQYQSVRNLLGRFPSSSAQSSAIDFNSPQNTQNLPYFTTLHRTYRPILFKQLIPGFQESSIPVDPSKGGVSANSLSALEPAQCQVPMILPSRYACADMATGPVCSRMKSTSLQDNPSQAVSILISPCVDTWPLISARKWFYVSRKSLSVDQGVRGEACILWRKLETWCPHASLVAMGIYQK